MRVIKHSFRHLAPMAGGPGRNKDHPKAPFNGLLRGGPRACPQWVLQYLQPSERSSRAVAEGCPASQCCCALHIHGGGRLPLAPPAPVLLPREEYFPLTPPSHCSMLWALHKTLWNCPVHPCSSCLLSGHSPSTRTQQMPEMWVSSALPSHKEHLSATLQRLNHNFLASSLSNFKSNL